MTALTVLSLLFATASSPPIRGFSLISEFPLQSHGGIPFTIDLNQDERAEVLWLQSPGLFHSKVFDVEPWLGKFSDAERAHFCLTATDNNGEVLWQVGEPWRGERPFVTHCAERALDAADLDGDGDIEIVCVRRSDLLLIDARTGTVQKTLPVPADNGQIVRIARTGPGAADWTVLVKNSERAYPPHEYANPAWFYSASLEFLATADFLGAGHAPIARDLDRDGLDEFLIGFNRVDQQRVAQWTFNPVPQPQWDAAEMHVDSVAAGDIDGKTSIAFAASDMLYLVDAASGQLVWKHSGVHPQFCLFGRFHPDDPGTQVLLHNKRANLELFDGRGNNLWSITPAEYFPLGKAAPCQRQAFHMFDPLTVIPGAGAANTDLVIFTDAGWPYVIGGLGQRCLEFPYTPNAAQDWGEVPGRPDDYGYGYYARVAELDGDAESEVLINDRRFAWIYEMERTADAVVASTTASAPPRSDGSVLHVDFENYFDGVVQALNAGVRWLGDPYANFDKGVVEVTRDFAFSGARCGHIESSEPAKIARIRLQKRFDVPAPGADSVIEFMFRAVHIDAKDLHDMEVCRPLNSAGLVLLANGDAQSGQLRLDVMHKGTDKPARVDGVATGLPQDTWIHVVMHRRKDQGRVDLWVGPPGQEVHAGQYPDLDPNAAITAIELGDGSRDDCQGSGYWDDVRIGAPLAQGQQVAPPEPRLRNLQEESASISYPIHVDSKRQLFVDDVAIESLVGLQRTLHPASPHPKNPLMLPEARWETDGLFFVPLSVLRERPEDPLRMWYGSYRRTPDKFAYTCVAESGDGLAWNRPAYGLVEFEGSRENNIVWEGRTVRVNYDLEDADPTRRYKGMTRTDAFTPLFSPDGIHWAIEPNPVISQAYDASSIHWDPIAKTWIFSCKIFRDDKRARGYAESKDFVNWSDTCLMLSADEKDGPQDHLYSLRIWPYETIFLGMLKVYHLDTDRCDVQLAFSRDARHWERPFREPFLRLSDDPNAPDYGNLDDASEPIPIWDELWFYYGGRNALHNAPPTRTEGSLCLATLRTDGFVSIEAGPEAGTLLTNPLVLDGKALFVNADAGNGVIRVAVVEEHPQQDGSYSPATANMNLASCTPITADNVRHEITWTGAPDLSALLGRAVRLQFSIQNAHLYAFWTE